MAIAVVSSNATAINNQTGTSISFTLTCSGSNLMLVAYFGYVSYVGAKISSVTYNGVGLTKAVEQHGGTGRSHEIWTLANPATGSAYTLQANYGSGTEMHMHAICFSGVDTTGATGAGTFSTTNWTGSITTQSANSMVVQGATGNYNYAVFSPGSSQTEYVETATDNNCVSSNYKLVASAGVTSLTLNTSMNTAGSMVLLELKEKLGGNRLTLLGVS